MEREVMSLAEMWALVDRTERNLDRIERVVEKNSEDFAKYQAENAESFAALKAQIAKTDAQIAATSAELSGVGITNGLLTEDLIYNALCDTMTFGGATFDYIDRSVKRKWKSPDGKKIRGEFDVVLYNCNAIALVDIKYRARIGDIDYLINTQLPKFRMFFPQYQSFKTYLGLGGLAFEEGVEAAALRMGIGTLKLNGEVVEVNDANLKVWG